MMNRHGTNFVLRTEHSFDCDLGMLWDKMNEEKLKKTPRVCTILYTFECFELKIIHKLTLTYLKGCIDGRVDLF